MMRAASVLPCLALLLAGCPVVPKVAIGERLDNDGDGAYGLAFGGADCDDLDAAIGPEAKDLPGDDIDQDCDGELVCPDGDGDGDTICDDDDICAAGTDLADDDGDGVPDACDACAGDDAKNLDEDALADDCDTDDDGDLVADDDEVAYGSDPRAADSDGDGLLDGTENANRDGQVDGGETDARAADTDGDGLCDGGDHVGDCVGTEFDEKTSPTSPDTDADGVVDGDEVLGGTSPIEADTDGDGLSDGVELAGGTDPLEVDTDGDGWKDGYEDTDHDGLIDPGESDPTERDTDADGLEDPVEAGGDHVVGTDETDPQNPDTDGDGVLDGAELDGDTDKDGKIDARDPDSDDDGLTDGEEVTAKTDPHDADSDDDGLTDGDEVTLHATSPLAADSDGDGLDDDVEILELQTDPNETDTDGDTLDDKEEVENTKTDPRKADTDGDGIGDAVELRNGTSPRDSDSDDDGLYDKAEDVDADGVVDAGETSPKLPDTNKDGRCDAPRRDNDGDGVQPADPCQWVFYVRAGAPSGGDGSSWGKAFAAMPEGAVVGDNAVWVAQGTYRPAAARAPVLTISRGTKFYGGFAGTETSLSQRPTVPLPTILDGDFDQSGGVSTSSDSDHTVLVTSASTGGRLDGFVVKNGWAGRTTPAAGGGNVRVDGATAFVGIHLVLDKGDSDGVGGGLYVKGTPSATFEDVDLLRGHADTKGGCAYFDAATVTITDSSISLCTADAGAGMLQRGGTVTADGLDITRNVADSGGGGLSVEGAGTFTGVDVNLTDNAVAIPYGCYTSGGSAGGGLLVHTSTVSLTGGSLSRNTADGGGSGACLISTKTTLRDMQIIDNGASSTAAIEMPSVTGTVHIVRSELAGATQLINASGGTLRLVDSTVDRKNAGSAVSATADASLIGSSISGDVQVSTAGLASRLVTHTIIWGAAPSVKGTFTDHSAIKGWAGGGSANVALVVDPFVRRDRDTDGVFELYLKHAGLDGEVADSPAVNGGDSGLLDSWFTQYGIRWAGTTSSNGAVDTGVPDIGRHY